MKWRSEAQSHEGKVRKINEDSMLDRPDSGLWVVADGMGGHSAGDIASQTIVSLMQDVPADGSLAELITAVEDRLVEANRRLVEIASERNQKTIGSTVVVLLARGRYIVCMWAGDSRVYRLRGGRITQITQDHAMVEDLVSSGVLSREEAESHPQANRITRAIGATGHLYVDMEIYEAKPGDCYVLCSDGLYKELSAADIRTAVGRKPEGAAARLIEETLQRGARDNVTVITVQAA